MNAAPCAVSRRGFLKTSVTAAGGLMLAWHPLPAVFAANSEQSGLAALGWTDTPTHWFPPDPPTAFFQRFPPKFRRQILRESLLPLKNTKLAPGLKIGGPPRVSRSSYASPWRPPPAAKFQ